MMYKERIDVPYLKHGRVAMLNRMLLRKGNFCEVGHRGRGGGRREGGQAGWRDGGMAERLPIDTSCNTWILGPAERRFILSASRTEYGRCEIAQELVDWFNAVDATYKADLRELNELNFQRFDAKLEQRLAEQNLWIERRFTDQTIWIERRFAQQDAKIDRLRTELIKWMFLFWAGTALTVIGVMSALGG